MSSDLWRSLRHYKSEKHKGPLQRRSDTELDFLEKVEVRPAKLLYDTTVYIDILQDRFPAIGQTVLRAVQGWHSPVAEAEMLAAAGLLNPRDPRRRAVVDRIARVVGQLPVQRTIIPDSIVWREAGFLSGILARLQGYDKSQRRRMMNDALLFVTARRHGCTLLTRNVSDFDFLQQLEPAGRVMFYRV